MSTPKRAFNGIKKISNTLKSIAESDIALEIESDLRKGLGSKELQEKYASRITARSILNALTGSEKASNVAIRDLRDRSEGRPVERKDIKHHLENLSDEEIKAMLLTEIDDLKNEEKLKKAKPTSH